MASDSDEMRGASPPTIRKRLFELWLEHGWSPPKVAGRVLAVITVAIPVAGYVTHRGSPGAAWWLVAALGVFSFWAVSDAVRWRIRHDRLPTLEAHRTVRSNLEREQGDHLATKEELTQLRTAFEESIRFNFVCESVKVDLIWPNSNADPIRFATFWFHLKNASNNSLAYCVVGDYVRVGGITSSFGVPGDQRVLTAGESEDYPWHTIRNVTQDDLKDVEVHLVVHYGRPTGGPRFAMDCLVRPFQSAWFEDGWPSNWRLSWKRETTHEPVA